MVEILQTDIEHTPIVGLEVDASTCQPERNLELMWFFLRNRALLHELFKTDPTTLCQAGLENMPNALNFNLAG